MKKYFFLSAITLSLFVFGQFRNTGETNDPRIKFLSDQNTSLFDMSKITVDHTVSMGYVSNGSNSMMVNEYIAGIGYKFSDPLSLKLQLGMSYSPYNSFSQPGENPADIYLKSATLDYKPNDTFRMRIDFRNIRPSDYLMNNHNDPFSEDFFKE